MVLVATPRGAMVVLQDDIGPFDSVKAASGGAQFTVHTDALLSARTSNASATAARHDSAVIRRVLVLGTAGWESKFTTAALEEAGWKVDELVHVAPGVDVSQNAGYHVDTTRYSAVVALDEAAAPWAAAIDEYVRSGGGVIIAPAAAGKLPATLRAAISGPTVVPAINDAPATLANIAFSPLVSVRSDAIVLDRRGNAVAIAARRHVAGRVIQIGYPESWRWRMAGTEQAVEEHRDWWSKLVSAAAYSPRVLLAGVASESDPAPYASLIAAIGPPVVGTIARMPVTASHSMVWMAVLVALTLVTEIASRRLRGAK